MRRNRFGGTLAKRAVVAAVTLCVCHGIAFAVACNVVPPHQPSEAEQAYLRGQFDRAATLYQAQLQQAPNDPTTVDGLALALLRQQKIAEAHTLVESAIAAKGDSAILYTALGEVQYREGTPWLAATSVEKARSLDTCYPRGHLLAARLYRLNSSYASAAKSLALAHALDPHDPGVRLAWLGTLPLAKRIAELEAYLASDTGDDPKDIAHLHIYLESLKKSAAEPHKPCRLVSDTASTEIPFATMMRDGKTIRAFGLDVKLDDHNARLQIDTGASGLLISRSVAEHAHLERLVTEVVSGIGSKGEQASYSAYASSIRIGALEFHDCNVRVVNKGSIMDSDGLIGMDVFSSFLVTLDFPMRKLVLGALPKRPDDETTAKPTLQTEQKSDEDDDEPSNQAQSAPTAQPASDKAAAPSSTVAPPAAKPSHGPHDRYFAPEMKDWTAVYRSGHDLLIRTLMNGGSPRLFILDTGAFATTVSPDAARSVTKVHSDDRMHVRGISGEVDKVFTADSIEFQFGNIRQKATGVVSFDTASTSRNLGLDVAGFIGATTLGQVVMSIDYRDGLVRFVYDANRGYKYPGVR